MDPIEIRRLFIDDEIWERTSGSYKALMPHRDFNCHRDDDETPQQHFMRLRPQFDVPLEVIEQWLYPLYFNIHSVINYGWLDYERVRFTEATMPASQLSELKIVEQFSGWVNGRKASTPFKEFACRPQDLAHWQEKGTWRVAPIVLDVSTLTEIPVYAKVTGPYQLVEGHTRLGYLLAMLRSEFIASEKQHLVYLMGLR